MLQEQPAPRAGGSTVTSRRPRPQQEEAAVDDRKSGDVTH